MTIDDSILTMRLRVMRRAHELNSVTLACREAGISRTVFYRWRTRFERYGADGLHPRRHHARRGRPRQIAPLRAADPERAILATQAAHLVLLRRQPVLVPPSITVGLPNPIPDPLGRRFELAPQFFGGYVPSASVR